MGQSRLQEILEKHKKWLANEDGGEKADLRHADLRGADLSYANLRHADLRGADLSYADLRHADLRGADLSYANLRHADLRRANLSSANLSYADLSDADLRRANLSSADGLLQAIGYIDANFERTEKGYIVYKTFGMYNSPPESWKIEPNSILEENVNFDRCLECACGINVATLGWVERENTKNLPIWKCLIEWAWLAGVCVPYHTDGKIRCEKVRLLERVK